MKRDLVAVGGENEGEGCGCGDGSETESVREKKSMLASPWTSETKRRARNATCMES